MDMKVYRTGNAKNKVQPWQMCTEFVFGQDVLRIVRGTKYEIRENNGKNPKVKRYPQFGNKYYLPRGTNKISDVDWRMLVQCLSENKKEHTYVWDSHEMKLAILQHDPKFMFVRITGDNCVYEFRIAREPR